MNSTVFLSYAEEDATTARRVYLALERSGLVRAWGYKESGRPGVDFREEFEAQIKACQYFCLLDSPHSRASRWIAIECGLALQSSGQMVICRLADPGSGGELFDGHDLRRAIDFANVETGIRHLFTFLQITYNPWSPIPRDRDFEEEVFRAGLNVDRAQELFDLYREFREHFADLEFAEALLRVIIRKCQAYGARDVVSPSLALGVIHADTGRHQNALRVFSDLSKTHATDPRAWAGLAGAYYYLNRYEPCLDALNRCVQVGMAHYREDAAARMAEIVHNIASVQILLERYDEAEAALRGLSVEEREHPFVKAVTGRLLLARGQYQQALPYIEDAHRVGVAVSQALVIDLANCYRQLGRDGDEASVLRTAVAQSPASPELCHRAADCYLRQRDTASALDAMRMAADRSQESPRYRAQLAALLCRARSPQEGRAEAERCTALAAPTAQDRYYRGLAYYVLGKRVTAADELSESRKDPVVSRWPTYAEIFD